ncbi:MAG: hypothetical protein VYA69_07480 [Gemmatimonadota bacterium]|nr:hypothetical protein [Gemmatimonadota bacterium]
MNRKMKVLSASLLVIALWVEPATAQKEHADQNSDRLRRSPIGSVDLSDAQREQMRTLRFDLEKDSARLRADQEVAQIELREVLNEINPHATAATAAAGKVNEARSAIFQREIAFQVAMKHVLTTEQQAQLQKNMRERRGRVSEDFKRRALGRPLSRPGQPSRPSAKPRQP